MKRETLIVVCVILALVFSMASLAISLSFSNELSSVGLLGSSLEGVTSNPNIALTINQPLGDEDGE
jgi:hypothetical protein